MLKIFSLISTVLIAFAIWGLIRQVRKTQRLHLAAPIIGLIIAPIMLIINLIFLNRALPGWLAPALLVMGLGFGLAWGQTARLSRQHGAIVTRRSVLHLIFWAIAYAVTQLLITFAPLAAVAGGLAAMFFSTGTTVGTNLNLLGRALRLRRQA